MATEMAFAWTEDRLPGWRSVKGYGLAQWTPAQAVRRAREQGQKTDRILIRTAAELEAMLEVGGYERAHRHLKAAEKRLTRGRGPTEEVEHLLELAIGELDQITLSRGVSMLVDAVRAARE